MPGKRKKSRAAANVRGRSPSAPAKRSALDHLKPAEAAAVLRRLLDEKRDLVPEAEALAMAMLCGTSMDDVADDVEDALECCRGIVVGLYRARALEDGEVLGWAPDCIAESACNALVAWHAGGTEHMFGPGSRRRREERAFPAELIARFAPDWKELIERTEGAP